MKWVMPRAVLKISIFAVVMLPILVSLGFWQLDRAQQKQDLLDLQKHVRHQGVLHLDGKSVWNAEPHRLLSLQGNYSDKAYLLDNRTFMGRSGYEVLQVFHMTGEDPRSFILVNRGWIAAPNLRSELPLVEVPDSGNTVALQGMLMPFTENFVLSEGDEPDITWPRRVQSLGFERASQELGGIGLVPKIFRIEKDEPGALQVLPAQRGTSVEKHKAYALQWFSLAITLLVLSVLASLKLSRTQKAASASEVLSEFEHPLKTIRE